MRTSTQRDRFKAALLRTWGGIAHDCLTAVDEMRRDDVIDIVLDNIDVDAHPTRGGLSPDDKPAWAALTREEREAIAREVFTYASYCL